MQVQFCNDNELSEGIFSLINKEITPELSKKQISNQYKKWEDAFNEENDDLVISNETVSSNFDLPVDKSQVGIDFPTWFNINSSVTKKIMLLGIDPLRHKDEFNTPEINIYSNAIIGTPYALHRQTMRHGANGQPKTYWEFIKSLLDENYGVYLTDIFKVFFMSQNQRSYNNKNFIENKKHLKQILDIEIRILNPDLIIVLGNKPLQLLNKKGIKISSKISKDLIYNNIPLLPMVHLSGLASGGRKKFIANNLYEIEKGSDVNSYLKIVDTFIQEIDKS